MKDRLPYVFFKKWTSMVNIKVNFFKIVTEFETDYVTLYQ